MNYVCLSLSLYVYMYIYYMMHFYKIAIVTKMTKTNHTCLLKMFLLAITFFFIRSGIHSYFCYYGTQFYLAHITLKKNEHKLIYICTIDTIKDSVWHSNLLSLRSAFSKLCISVVIKNKYKLNP